MSISNRERLIKTSDLISTSALTELAVGNWNHVTQWAAYLAYDKSEMLFATYQFSKAFKKSKITVSSERVQNPQ